MRPTSFLVGPLLGCALLCAGCDSLENIDGKFAGTHVAPGSPSASDGTPNVLRAAVSDLPTDGAVDPGTGATESEIRVLLILDPKTSALWTERPLEWSDREPRAAGNPDDLLTVAQSLAGDSPAPFTFSHDATTTRTMLRRAAVETTQILAAEHPLLPLGPLEEHALALFAAAGAYSDEVHVDSGLLRVIGSGPDIPQYSRVIGYKVHLTRRVLQAPVSGDYFHITFAPDGSLMKILAKWRAVDYAHTAVPNVLDETHLLDLAAQRLAEANLAVSPTVEAIEIGVHFYYPSTMPSTDASATGELPLVLRGHALIRDANGSGAGTEGKIPVHYFSLDEPGGYAVVPDDGESGGASNEAESGGEG